MYNDAAVHCFGKCGFRIKRIDKDVFYMTHISEFATADVDQFMAVDEKQMVIDDEEIFIKHEAPPSDPDAQQERKHEEEEEEEEEDERKHVDSDADEDDAHVSHMAEFSELCCAEYIALVERVCAVLQATVDHGFYRQDYDTQCAEFVLALPLPAVGDLAQGSAAKLVDLRSRSSTFRASSRSAIRAVGHAPQARGGGGGAARHAATVLCASRPAMSRR